MNDVRPSRFNAVFAIGALLLSLVCLTGEGLPISYRVTMDNLHVRGWYPGGSLIFGGAILTPAYLLLRRRSLRRSSRLVRASLWLATLLFGGKALVELTLAALAFVGAIAPRGPVDHNGFFLTSPTPPETWWIDDEPHDVHTTYYQRVGDELLFRIEVPYEGAGELSERDTFGTAWPYLRHAWKERVFSEDALPFTSPPRPIDRVVVSLFETRGFVVRGRRAHATPERFPELAAKEDAAVALAGLVARAFFDGISDGRIDEVYAATSLRFRSEQSAETLAGFMSLAAERLGRRIDVRPLPPKVRNLASIRFRYGAEYEHDPAVVICDVRLERGAWRVDGFRVESFVFRDAPDDVELDREPGTRIEPERYTGRWIAGSAELSIRDDGTYSWTLRKPFGSEELRGRWVSGGQRVMLLGFRDPLRFEDGTLVAEQTDPPVTYRRAD